MKMKRNLNRGILATLGIVCLSACATDGTLNVSGTVDWFDVTKWADGQIASGGNATVKGEGTVSVGQPVSITAIGHHEGSSVTLSGASPVAFAAAGGSAVNVGVGQLTFNVPVQIQTNLTLRGPGRVNFWQPMTAPQDTAAFHSALHLNNVTVGMDYSYGSITANMMPFENPLFVDAASTIRMGGAAECTQTFSSYDLNAPLNLGGGDATAGKKARYYSRNPGGIKGTGALTLGGYESDATIFYARDIYTRYDVPVTINGAGQLVITPFGFGEPNDPTAEQLPVTDGLLFHVDASDAATLTTEVRDGRTVVTRWADASGGDNAAVAPEGAQAAVLLPNELNGRPVVDFGPASGNAGMDWLNTLTEIHDVFLVLGSQEGGGTLLGTKQNETGYIYERGRNLHVVKGNGRAGDYTVPFTRDNAFFFNWNTISDPYVVFLNGDSERGNINTAHSSLSGGYDLIEIVTSSAGAASAFARRAGLEEAKRAGREGGQRLAEVAIFNRSLTVVERKKVEAYLLKKWFNRDRIGFGPARAHAVELKPKNNWHDYGMLQSGYAGRPVCVDSLKITSSNTYYTMEASDNVEAGRLETERKLRLMGGRMAFTARQTSVTLPVPHPAFHVDATTGVEVDGAGKVTTWRDASGGTVVAVPEDGYAPTLVANGLNGKPVVDFGAANSCQHFVWSSNIVVRTHFFVLKATNNKVTFLGSSSTSRMAVIDNFTRYLNDKDYIYNHSSFEGNLGGGFFLLDGARVMNPPQQRFDCATLGFRVLSHALEAGMMANAFGCGAYQSSNHRAERTGGLQIAEAIIYDRKLTEDECLDVQAYLRWKWFGETLVGYAKPGEPYTLVAAGSGNDGSRLEIRGTTPVTIKELFGGARLTLTAPDAVVTIPNVQGSLVLNNARLAASGTIPAGRVTDLPGTTNTLAAGSGTFAAFNVTGALAVKGPMAEVTALTFASGSELVLGTNVWERHSQTLGDGMTISSEVAADRTTGHLALCDVAVAGGGTVKLALDPALAVDPVGQYPVVTYGSLATEDIDDLRTWNVSVTPALPEKYHVSLAIVNNAVYVNIAPSGMIIIVR